MAGPLAGPLCLSLGAAGQMLAPGLAKSQGPALGLGRPEPAPATLTEKGSLSGCRRWAAQQGVPSLHSEWG